MAWNLFANTVFPAVATPSVAQGAALYDNWIETGGNTNEILASGLIAQTSIVVTSYKDARLMRPLSESKRNSRLVVTYVAFAVGAPSILCYLRGNHDKSTFTGYIPFISQDGTTFRLYPCVNGVLKTLVNVASGTTTVIGTQYKLDVEVVQTDASTSTLTYTLRNLDGSQRGNVMTIVDATPELQNIAGVPGLSINANGVSPIGLGRFAAAQTYQQPPVESTTYTVNAQTAGAVNIASSAFLVYPNNDGVFADTTITPSDNGGGGTFTPSSIVLAALQTLPGSFTYTAGSAGVKTISYANGGALSNPANTSYTADIYNIVGIDKARFSPGNWKGDTGRGGSLYRKTWNVGAWFTYKWTASTAPSASILIAPSATTDTLAIYLNGVLTNAVAAIGNTSVVGVIPNAVNTLKVYVTDSINNYRWNDGINTVQINGLLLDIGSVEIDVSATMPWGVIIGDSITQGVKANSGVGSFIHSYTFGLENYFSRIGYDLCVNACSQSGWIVPGDGLGDVPAYYKVSSGSYNNALSRWNRIDENVSLLDSNGMISAYGDVDTEPDFIISNLLTNDTGTAANVPDVQSSIFQSLSVWRLSAPNAVLILIVPPGLYDTSIGANSNSAVYIAAKKSAYNTYVVAYPNDGMVELIDLGVDFAKTLSRGIYTADGIHPSAIGHSLMIAALLPKISASLEKLRNRWTYS